MNDFRVMQELCENISSSAITLQFDLKTAEKKDELEESFLNDLLFSMNFIVTQARALEAVWEDKYGKV
jgi:hypothetical protein